MVAETKKFLNVDAGEMRGHVVLPIGSSEHDHEMAHLDLRGKMLADFCRNLQTGQWYSIRVKESIELGIDHEGDNGPLIGTRVATLKVDILATPSRPSYFHRGRMRCSRDGIIDRFWQAVRLLFGWGSV